MMKKKEKLVIYTGGFAFYFFTVLIILSLAGFIGGIRQAINKELTLDIGVLFGSLVIVWGIVYMTMYLRSNRIELTKDRLNVITVDRTIYNRRLFPKVKKASVNLNDIQAITLALAKHLDKMAQTQDDKALKEDLDKFKQIGMLPTGKMVFPIKTWTGLKYTPLVYIVKKQGKPFIVDTKPFSKKDFGKLIKALQEKGISVEIQQGVL